MKIYIDGDGCPVKSTIFEIAADFFIEVILVTSFDHYSKQELPANVQIIYVDSGMDAADFRILTLLSAGDVLVTQDYGLASLAIGKGVRIIHHTGFEYTKNNIENLMQTRYLSAIERKNGKHTKGPRAFTDEKKEIFRASFLDLMKSIKKPEKSNDQL